MYTLFINGFWEPFLLLELLGVVHTTSHAYIDHYISAFTVKLQIKARTMAADSAKSCGSADSFIGCFISLISKAEIRYEGFLFHINPQESTIGLQNVKSFGTEGRRQDGPQVLPIDKVYDYIFFRGSDIKDLQVLSSPPVQITPAVPNDPAIIQAHYPCSTSPSSSYLSASAASPTNISSSAHLGHPNPISHGILSLDQPAGRLRSWDSFPPPPTGNGNGIAIPTYWPDGPDHIGFSGGVSHMQSLAMNTSLPSDTSNFVQFSRPLLPTVGTSSPYLTFTMPPPSPLPTSVPMIQSVTLPPKLSPNLIPSNGLNVPPTLTLHPDSRLVSSLVASGPDVNPIVPPAVDRPKSVYKTVPQSMSSIGGSSSLVDSEVSMPSLLTQGDLLRPGPPGQSSSHLQTAQKDIEVVQGSTSVSFSSDSKVTKNPAQPLPSPSAGNLDGAIVDSHHTNKHQAQGKRNILDKTALHTHHVERDSRRGKENWLKGDPLRSHRIYRVQARGSANRLNGASLHPHEKNSGDSWCQENEPSRVCIHTHRTYRGRGRGKGNQITTAVHTHHSHRGRGRGKGNKVSLASSKFTEDFDFEAMNEKFNKEEIWGHLSRSNKIGLENHEVDVNDNGANESEEQDEFKTFYLKDDFFDSLSCNSFNRELGKGRAKLSEQRRMDIETFGESPRHRRDRSSHGRGLVGQLQGSHGMSFRPDSLLQRESAITPTKKHSDGSGRGYGQGRGRGRTVWTRVT